MPRERTQPLCVSARTRARITGGVFGTLIAGSRVKVIASTGADRVLCPRRDR